MKNSVGILVLSLVLVGPGCSAGKEQSRCLDVPVAKAAALQRHVPLGLSVRAIQAVKSTESENVYFVSGEIEGGTFQGKSDNIATWVTDNLEEVNPGARNAGSFAAAPGLARDLMGSAWDVMGSAGESLGFDAKESDDGYQQSQDCVRATLEKG